LLNHLTIKNYALIESLEASFFEGFSVMTGETGAGKSIILGALALIFGHRADLQSLKSKTEKCVVEGFFSVNNRDYEGFFMQQNLDFDPETIILRREILPSGKSRAFINDTPVGLSQLRELAGKLVDLHSQNSTTLLQDTSFQLGVLDNYCNNSDLLLRYKNLFREYKNQELLLNKLRKTEKEKSAEQDFFVFQYEELHKAALRTGEQEEAEEELEVLGHAEEIKTRLFEVSQMIEREHGLNAIFGNIISQLKPLKTISHEFSAIFNRIESNFLDISDISSELNKIDERIEINPSRMEDLQERINTIYRLQQKHRVSDVEGLLNIMDEYLRRINLFASLGEEISISEKLCNELSLELDKMANSLSSNRKNALHNLEKKITETVSLLGMPDAKVKLVLSKLSEKSETGFDRIVYMFNANKGGEMQEMSKIASGGELSRLMLAIKSQVATKNLVSTIIFDEIDSGVSGEVAAKMAGIMYSLGKDIQIISITHLPQIAARGEHHYLVSKSSGSNDTTTSVKLLTQPERITEIAKMLSDSHISNSALQTAAELMKSQPAPSC